MPDIETSKWHWSEGNKYAVESGKALLYLNGGAAISILTFVGNHRSGVSLVISITSFALGALVAALAFIFAYLTQLHYGNRELGVSLANERASRFHNLTYCAAGFSAFLFLFGMIWGAVGIK